MSTPFTPNQTADYTRVEQAIRYLEQNFHTQPDLKAVADHIGLSEYHFQRLFTRWAGISPKRFLQFLTVEYAKQLLTNSQDLLHVTYEAGLSSPSRLHDLFIASEAVTPGEFKRKGAGLTIVYGFHETPFGECLLAVTERGICGLTFVTDGARETALNELQHNWPLATLRMDVTQTEMYIQRIFSPAAHSAPLKLYLQGSNFQLKVWQALLNIPSGTAVSYDTIATWIDNPKASRAIGTALAHNPIGYLIPCHRVIRKAGQSGEYRWGSTRKKAILGWEAAHRDTSQGRG